MFLINVSFENVNWNEVIKATNETLYMTFIPTFMFFVIGLLLGILLFLTGKGRSLQKISLFILFWRHYQCVPLYSVYYLVNLAGCHLQRRIMTTIIGPKGQFNLSD